MNKILVTTDFSSNSQAAIRFAIQLASQQLHHLTFFHSTNIERPTQWSTAVYQSHENSESTKVLRKLQAFVAETYESMGLQPIEFDCVVKNNAATDRNIIQYAEENGYHYICLSRNGENKSSMWFGSNTSHLINKSHIPVIAVPSNYQGGKITKVAYAADLKHLDTELDLVVSFTQPLDAQLELLHFTNPGDELIEPAQKEAINKKISEYQLITHFEKLDIEKTLIVNMNEAFEKSKPSMVIMFTQQNRSFFEKIFSSSISAEYATMSDIPLLVFKK
ncbi:nucleotide-binding universal stress UspA family protein [Pedobacter sp. CAN_A7]|uniref:universal stress protein n=1 Tax=Pedobacter sp. CAN_A7 TaxID=2787722 RepID=UPI0018CA6A2D